MPSARKGSKTASENGAPAKGRRPKAALDDASESPGGTRELLLAAARKVLLEDGLPAVTTRRVADQANVNQALVHYHFGSIENLLLDVLDTVALDTRRAERIFYGPGDLRSKWRTLMDDLLRHEIPDGTTKIWAETLVMVSSNSDARQRYVDTIANSTHERLLEVVRSGLPEDTPGDEIEGLAALILAVRKAISLDSLIGWDRGQEELLRLVDGIIAERVGSAIDGKSRPRDAWPASGTSVAGDFPRI